jgi:SAM-dependent methyltransferase
VTAPGGVSSAAPPAPRDLAVSRDVSVVFESDPALRSLAVGHEVQGGVVHLRGTVDRDDELKRVRAALARTRGVLAVWDRVAVAGRPARALDLGCGGVKQWPDAVGVDLRAAEGVDVLADLERGALPFPDASFAHVFAVHVFEHVAQVCELMDEVHRVLQPGGMLHLLAPRWDAVNALADPTHVRPVHPQTFKYFCVGRDGRRVFRPLLVACDHDTVYADLEPVSAGEPLPDAVELARFFT